MPLLGHTHPAKMPSSLSTAFFFCIFCLSPTLHPHIIQLASAQSTTSAPLASPSPQPHKSGRLFHISSEGFMTKLLRTEPDFISSTAIIQRHVSHVEQGIIRFLRANCAPPSNQSLHPCNHDGRGFKDAMHDFLITRHLPEPDVTCLTEFEGVYNFGIAQSKYHCNGIHNNVKTTEQQVSDEWLARDLTEDQVYDAIITRAESMFRNRQKIADVILGNWTEPDVNIHYLYNTTSKRCVINHVGGLRVFNKWYIFTTVTNAPRRYSAPLFHRQWLNEFVHAFPNGTALGEPLHFSVPKRPSDDAPSNAPHIISNDTTTSLGSSAGFAGPYAFNSMYPEENPALVSAMDISDLAIQQADDALAPSSLAILLLPLALNMVPLALISDSATTLVTLIYALMTDVVTVVPLAIKGVELVLIGQQRHRAVVTRLTAAINGTRSHSSVMELWGAECKASDNVLPTGIAFVCIAIIFLIVGIVLEIAARAYVQRKLAANNMITLANSNNIHHPLTGIKINENNNENTTKADRAKWKAELLGLEGLTGMSKNGNKHTRAFQHTFDENIAFDNMTESEIDIELHQSTPPQSTLSTIYNSEPKL